MKRIIIALLSLVATSAFADIHSNNGFYVGGGVTNVKLANSPYTWTTVEAIGGYKLNPFVGGEIRIGGAGESDPNITDYFSAYYRVESANEVGKTYLLAGYTVGSMSGTYNNFSGFTFGVGIGFVMSDNINFNIEYKRLKDNKNNLDFSGFSACVDYRF